MQYIEINTKKEVGVKVLSICAKCSDCCCATLFDDEENEIFEHDGYVPDFMPGDHYGDYIMIDIDLETGQILNWVAPDREDLENFVNGVEE